jgi:hypothetical protein
LLCVSGGAAAQSEPSWFTVTGDAQLPQVDTVQVNPVALKVEGDFKTMRLRVSRSQVRQNWDGVGYRSYEARVLFNCRTRRAHYLDASFYQQPQWQGNPHQLGDYLRDPKPMLFVGMTPNPTDRIIRAACQGAP